MHPGDKLAIRAKRRGQLEGPRDNWRHPGRRSAPSCSSMPQLKECLSVCLLLGISWADSYRRHTCRSPGRGRCLLASTSSPKAAPRTEPRSDHDSALWRVHTN